MDPMKMKEELEKGIEAANKLSVILAESRRKEQYSKETLRLSRDNHSVMIIKSFDTALSMVRNAQLKQLPRLNTTSPCCNIPREYFRCGLKDQGCQATKKVQVISSNPIRYKIVYYGQHSCQNYHILGDEFGQDPPCMLSFGCNSTNSKPKKSKAKSESGRVHSGNHSSSSSLMIQEENKPSNPQDEYVESTPDDLMTATMYQLPETPFPVDVDMVSSMYACMNSAPYFVEEDYSSYLVADYDEPDNGFFDIQLWD
ncbi:hypothetical protein Cgig2_008798 [Carnegiea gigantea]|uniref:WRKY domain-containing protein n=1 Tax=Carnegiea gigantea TaxID=171969 RepID=A0A9Q1JQX9_9CARY|nr:hypothetical protein Cgig2_008798 [Carnegiea gigantea]